MDFVLKLQNCLAPLLISLVPCIFALKISNNSVMDFDEKFVMLEEISFFFFYTMPLTSCVLLGWVSSQVF